MIWKNWKNRISSLNCGAKAAKKKNLNFTGMKSWLTFYCGLLLSVSIMGCSKGIGGSNDPGNGNGGGVHLYNPDDTIPPVIEITTPAANQLFSNNGTISVTGKTSDDIGLYRGSIRITNDATGLVATEQLYEIHYILQYNFTLNYTPTVNTPTNYTVTVSYEDHGLNTTMKTVKIKVNP